MYLFNFDFSLQNPLKNFVNLKKFYTMNNHKDKSFTFCSNILLSLAKKTPFKKGFLYFSNIFIQMEGCMVNCGIVSGLQRMQYD